MSYRLRRSSVGPAFVVLALVASGCGNAGHDFRVDKLQPLVGRVNDQRARLAGILRISRPHRPRDAGVLRAQITQLGATMREIAALKPPAGTRAKFLSYTQANVALLASLSRFVDAFASGDLARQRQMGQETQAAVSAADQARMALDHALG